MQSYPFLQYQAKNYCGSFTPIMLSRISQLLEKCIITQLEKYIMAIIFWLRINSGSELIKT